MIQITNRSEFLGFPSPATRFCKVLNYLSAASVYRERYPFLTVLTSKFFTDNSFNSFLALK